MAARETGRALPFGQGSGTWDLFSTAIDQRPALARHAAGRQV